MRFDIHIVPVINIAALRLPKKREEMRVAVMAKAAEEFERLAGEVLNG